VEAPPTLDLAARGKEIYFGMEYSNTGLSCADCHAASPADEANGKLIAHTGYGAAPRGSWKHTDQAMLDAGAGRAATLLEAANMCVSAPYMNSKDHQISGQDGEALEAYMASIADPSAWDAAPFVIEVSRSMPAAGLTPDMENGHSIYENTCERCHEGVEGIEELHGLGEWMNEMQLMAKIRKMPDWYDSYESATYANVGRPDAGRVVAWMLGSNVAYAQDGNPCGDNPCAGNPCGANPCGEAHADGDAIFGEDAMPFFASDILSDQDVVDVAHYLIANE
jgi:cytochrome c